MNDDPDATANHLMTCLRDASKEKRLEWLLETGEQLYALDSEELSEEVRKEIWRHLLQYYFEGLVVQEHQALSRGGSWKRISHIKVLEALQKSFSNGEIKYPDIPQEIIEELTRDY